MPIGIRGLTIDTELRDVAQLLYPFPYGGATLNRIVSDRALPFDRKTAALGATIVRIASGNEYTSLL